MTIITCEDITKNYGCKNALNNFSVTIKQNTITGLVGRNGAGKTTLLRMIAGHIIPSSGEIKVFNEDPFNNLLISANSIIVHDSMDFPYQLTLLETLHIAESFYPNWDMDFAQKLFSYFNFEDDEKYEQLSKGKRSTFNFIVGLASRSPLTLLDEPTSGMDVAVRKDVYRALLKDYMNHPRTIIISSHYLEEIEDLLENLLLIDNGQMLLHLPIDEVKQYAIRIDGKTNWIEENIPEETIIAKRKLESNHSYVIVKNSELIKQFEGSNVNITPISPSELIVYLTNAEGGIDHVFDTSIDQ